MLLAFDVGNTNIVLGVFKDGALIQNWRLETDNNKSADEYGMVVNQLFQYVGLKMEDVEDIICHNRDVIVIVDEAYVDFGGTSAVSLIEKYDNLLVVQTFSKSRSLAGMRIGFACGNAKLIKYLNDVKYSFNSYTMDRTALAAGVAAVKDQEYFEETCNKIIETREWTKKELKALGFSFQDSKSNFIFASHETCPAAELFAALREKHIYVRYFPKGRTENFLRITIGTREEMQKFIDFLKEYLK